MTIPETVKIGGINYNVLFVPEPSYGNEEIDGQIIYTKQEIRIKENMPQDYTEQVFIHELVHGIYDYCGLKGEDYEEQVSLVANVLHQVLKDNNCFTEEVIWTPYFC